MVFMPKDWQTVIDLMPQANKDCGLGMAVLIGDCTGASCLLINAPNTK